MGKVIEEKWVVADAATLVGSDATENGSLVGSVLSGQYEIVEVIGEGGIGVVYRARQLTVGRDVAIKILKKQFANDELASRRFENEAAAISRLRHPNTLRLYDCQRTTDGALYLVTEHLNGSSLSDILRREGRLSLERCLRLFDDVCRSLAEAHSHGIVHRDLKPSNIFIDRVGGEDLVKVLDFGIAKILQGGGGLTRAGAVPGTPQYMSPEQAQAARVDHRADIYTLGIILFQLVAGRAPFDGPSVMDILAKHITTPPPSLADISPGISVPAALERLIDWMLEKQPKNRPQSMDEIRLHVADILAGLAAEKSKGAANAPQVPRASALPPPRPRASSVAVMRRWRWISVTTGSLGVIFGVILGFLVLPAARLRPQLRAETISVMTIPDDAPRTEPISQLPHDRARIVSEPSGAKVVGADGEKVGITPLDVELRSATRYTLLGVNGHKGQVLLDPTKDGGRTVPVMLDGPRSTETGLDKPERSSSSREKKRRASSERKKRK